ncbi:uncharacterized protein LOC122265803, partial [Penaeus japonicus]|uniref:uncharacterized protein LOC122265803 n=1 Tax=Penaeus japonicus TaxID=27405 RepID=UPI001C7101C3
MDLGSPPHGAGDRVGHPPAQAFFAINSKTGELHLLRALDRDPPLGRSVWRVRVQVRDGQALWSRQGDGEYQESFIRQPRSPKVAATEPQEGKVVSDLPVSGVGNQSSITINNHNSNSHQRDHYSDKHLNLVNSRQNTRYSSLATQYLNAGGNTGESQESLSKSGIQNLFQKHRHSSAPKSNDTSQQLKQRQTRTGQRTPCSNPVRRIRDILRLDASSSSAGGAMRTEGWSECSNYIKGSPLALSRGRDFNHNLTDPEKNAFQESPEDSNGRLLQGERSAENDMKGSETVRTLPPSAATGAGLTETYREGGGVARKQRVWPLFTSQREIKDKPNVGEKRSNGDIYGVPNPNEIPPPRVWMNEQSRLHHFSTFYHKRTAAAVTSKQRPRERSRLRDTSNTKKYESLPKFEPRDAIKGAPHGPLASAPRIPSRLSTRRRIREAEFEVDDDSLYGFPEGDTEDHDEGNCEDINTFTQDPKEEGQEWLLKPAERVVHVVETVVTVLLKDINDNPPVFPNATMFGEVQENGPISEYMSTLK